MFHKEDQGLVRFLPYAGVLALSALLSLLTNVIVSGNDLICPENCEAVFPWLIAEALDNTPFKVTLIITLNIGVIVMSFVAFRAPSVRRLVAYHAVQFLAFGLNTVAPILMFLARGGRGLLYDGLGAAVYVLRAAMALISGLGMALVFVSLANQVKQNKSGEYFRISVESQPTQGFYGMMRHPIFCGVVLMTFANTIFGSDFGFLIICALTSVVVFFCMRNEDAAKLRSGNDAVVQYIQQTPRLWPTRAGWANYFRGQSISRGIPMPLASSDDGLEMDVALSAPSGAVFDEPLSADSQRKNSRTALTLAQVAVALEEDPVPRISRPGTQTRSPRSPGSPGGGLYD
eukprot:TRINITY_DN3121_c0_g1_i3.p1 TRINITY_DN3121_c0_g1~~TRINITY_DN3121_c0_g1_i3.p1  ORF type:complete len:345 (+),score=50.65 TRINITY_DN3121_c0_g1_i3:180-1214(+)